MREKLAECCLCPRQCKVNRLEGEKGFCRGGKFPRVADAGLHFGEEPCISGKNGSGTVFFAGCTLRCVFCQNYQISQQEAGREIGIEELANIFLRLQRQQAHNINLVTPTHYVPQILEALSIAREKGFSLPVVYNTSGYELVETIKLLEGWVDVYMPDLKYFDPEHSRRYSLAPDYFMYASQAIKEMFRQVGPACYDEEGVMIRGVLIRLLLMPGLLEDAKKIASWIAQEFPQGVPVSLMSQYTPVHRAHLYPEINRRVSRQEYEELIEHFQKTGLEEGFIQDRSSASRRFIPPFKGK